MSNGIVVELANEVMYERCDGVDLKVRVGAKVQLLCDNIVMKIRLVSDLNAKVGK